MVTLPHFEILHFFKPLFFFLPSQFRLPRLPRDVLEITFQHGTLALQVTQYELLSYIKCVYPSGYSGFQRQSQHQLQLLDALAFLLFLSLQKSSKLLPKTTPTCGTVLLSNLEIYWQASSISSHSLIHLLLHRYGSSFKCFVIESSPGICNFELRIQVYLHHNAPFLLATD